MDECFHERTGVVTEINRKDELLPAIKDSCDSHGIRACNCCRMVHDGRHGSRPSSLANQFDALKAISRERLVLIHRIFDQRTLVLPLSSFRSSRPSRAMSLIASMRQLAPGESSDQVFAPRAVDRWRSTVPGDRCMAARCIACSVAADQINEIIVGKLRQ